MSRAWKETGQRYNASGSCSPVESRTFDSHWEPRRDPRSLLPVCSSGDDLLQQSWPVQLNLQASPQSDAAAFQGDIIGAMLAQTFSSLFTTLPFTSETQVYLLNINKVSNVLYCQFLLTLHNVTVDSRKRDSYFVTFETIVISTKDNVYTICDFVPSEEPMPRGQVPAELTEWLNGFAVFSE